MKLALLLVVAACSSTPDKTPSEPTPIPAAPALLADHKQLVTAIVDDWTSTTATLRLWELDTTWRPVGDPWTAVVGNAGTAWGDGLHGTGAPSGHTGPSKVEGDGKSPAGAFSLVASYGYASAPPAGTQLPYVQTTSRWKCVDDSSSRDYNRVFDAHDVHVDWKSAEDMKRSDELYTWVVEVAHNPTRRPSSGSCIFLHVWSGKVSTTSGCTAMPEPTLSWLLSKIDPTLAPAFVLLPRAEYDALASAWGLPTL